MRRLGFLVLTVWATTLWAVPASPARAAELVYFYSDACTVCERWNEEVGGIYNKTEEAQRLTLRRQNIHEDKPADLAFVKAVTFTPTFVAIEEGREVGRMVGYISDYFFWEQMSGLIKKADAAKQARLTACSEPGAQEAGRTC